MDFQRVQSRLCVLRKLNRRRHALEYAIGFYIRLPLSDNISEATLLLTLSTVKSEKQDATDGNRNQEGHTQHLFKVQGGLDRERRVRLRWVV